MKAKGNRMAMIKFNVLQNLLGYQVRYFKFAPLYYGQMAEWLGSALQKLLHRFESGSDLTFKSLTINQLGFFIILYFIFCYFSEPTSFLTI